MPKKRILLLSDPDLKGSGYFNIAVPLASGLVDEYEVKALGLGYKGEEHNYPFSIIPIANFQEVFAMLQNMVTVWPFDGFLVALDIPLQEMIVWRMKKRPFKYIGIMPVEADPLCASWAMSLMLLDKVFVISEFGANEALKAGITTAEWIKIGLDTESWRIPKENEVSKIRQSLFGVDDPETFVVLTVADNQERKNLSRST